MVSSKGIERTALRGFGLPFIDNVTFKLFTIDKTYIYIEERSNTFYFCYGFWVVGFFYPFLKFKIFTLDIFTYIYTIF